MKVQCVTEKLANVAKIFLFVIPFLLIGCIEVKQSINIYSDGSGYTRIEVAVQREWSSLVIPRLKQDIPKGWDIIEEKDNEGKHFISIGRKFNDISELNDAESRYVFSMQREGYLKKSYSLEIDQLKTAETPFPYEVSVNIPGSITETNGMKVSTGEAKWNLFGIKKGTQLVVKSSSFLLPSVVIYLALGLGAILFAFIAIKVFKRSRVTIPEVDIPSKTIFCTQCGKKNDANATFCTSCGEKL